VQCSSCGAQGAPGKKFCADCGASLGAACPACGVAVEPNQRFCADCGTPLTVASAPAPSQRAPLDAPLTERRVCSVLFCDLVGFTPLSESRDPEEVRELLSRYFDTARTIIARYGGIVEKFIGDAVMAVWGTPTAAEGDAERAVRAALDLVEAVGELGRTVGARDLAARAGVVTGEVAATIGAVGEGMVAGDTVNTAARVQAAAAPGQVLVDDTTWRVVREAVACAAAGTFELKGKAEPVTLWCAQRVVSAVGGGQRIDGLEAPLVGRDAELRLVKELFHASADRRSARLVSIVGPAGVGKSRIAWEFFKYIDGLATTVWWHRGRCLSYGDGVAFAALAEMVRQRLGIAEDDPAEVAADKLATGLAHHVADETVRSYIRPRLGQLLGVDTGAASLPRDELFPGWRSFFEQLALSSPVVLVIEDLHHADAGLLDFVEHLLDWARDVPIFVLTLARADIEERRPGWGTGRRNATSIAIEALDNDSMLSMIDGLVTGMPEAARAAVAAQAQGIPLYAVETVRMLIDRDVVQPVDGSYRLVGAIGELSVPESLQSLLAARLDALPDSARKLVSDAAVVGTTFPIDALVAVSGVDRGDVERQLAELVRREVLTVRADPLCPDRGQYAFVQTMFRQVAYDTLSRRERRVRHLAIANHLVSTFAEEGEEVSEVVAQHLLDALEAAPDTADARELRDRAVDMLVRAAGRAKRTGAPLAAAAAYGRAADLLVDGDSADRRRAAELLETSARETFEGGEPRGVQEQAARARDIYRELGFERDAIRATVCCARGARYSGHVEEAGQLLEPVLPMLEADPAPDTIEALSSLAAIQANADPERAAGTLDRAFALAQALDFEHSVYGELFLVRGVIHASRDRWIEAVADQRAALQVALDGDRPAVAGLARLNLCDALLVLGDVAGSADIGREAVTTFRLNGNQRYAFAVGNLVQALLLAGEWDEAAALATDTMRDPRVLEDLYFDWIACLFFALRGDIEQVPSLLQAAEAAVGDSEDVQDLSTLTLVRSWLALLDGDPASAAHLARVGFEQGAALGFASEASRWGWPVAAEAALALGDLDEVDRLLEMISARPPGEVAVVARADAVRVRARLLAARADAAAGETFVAATQALRDLGSPWHLAVGLADHADFCDGHEDAATADRLRDEARLIAARLGARPLLARLDTSRAPALT
jgi:class 3 adenylate cyclase